MREAAADTAGAVRGIFFPILIDCAGNTKGGASSPKGGKRVTARPEVPPLFSALIRRRARRRRRSLARAPVRRSARLRASCLPPGWRGKTMSGLGGVGSRKRPRLAYHPAGPGWLAGRRGRTRGAGLFHPAGAPSGPCPAVGELSWGGNLSPGGSAPFEASSIAAAAASAGSPPGLARSESPLPCAAGRPSPLSPGAAAAADAAAERTGPAPRARGEGAGLGGDTPSAAGGGFSLTFGS